jgi:hypothetical protein
MPYMFYESSFLKLRCISREKKLTVFVILLIETFIFEKRAANLIRMHKQHISTLKSAFGF